MSVSANAGSAANIGSSPWDSQVQEFDYRVEDVEGRLLEGLAGVLHRIGPGRLDVGAHPVGHIFDGDGMVSRVEFGPDGVHFRSRYVRTKDYVKTTETGRPPRGFSTQRLGGALANALRFPANMSNTNVLVHERRLYSLWEGGRPYRLDLETLDTVGIESFEGGLKRLGAFSAHPKTDPETGEVFNFGLDFYPRPMIRCYRLGRNRKLETVGSVPLTRLGFIHDFALTRRHMVFVLDPLVMSNPVGAALGVQRFDQALTFKPKEATRIVLVPRDGGRPVTVEHDAMFHFHVTNAYDTERETVIEIVDHNPGAAGWEGWNDHLRNFRDSPGPAFGGTLKRIVVDPNAHRARVEELNDRGCEFPQLDQRFTTDHHRYSYLAEASVKGGDPDTVAAVDHQSGEVRRYTCRGSDTICEPLFAPAAGSQKEGDGWLLTLEHQPELRRSRVLVLPAERPDQGPVAIANLRHHVPMTFHGAWDPRA